MPYFHGHAALMFRLPALLTPLIAVFLIISAEPPRLVDIYAFVIRFDAATSDVSAARRQYYAASFAEASSSR